MPSICYLDAGIFSLDAGIFSLDAGIFSLDARNMLFRCSRVALYKKHIGKRAGQPRLGSFSPLLSVEKLVLAAGLEQHRSRGILSDIWRHA